MRLPSELVGIIIADISFRCYARLMIVNHRFFELLNSPRRLLRRSNPILTIDNHRQGLSYFFTHDLVNYDDKLVEQDTYFRHYHHHLAIDVFDWLWIVRQGQLERVMPNIVKAYRINCISRCVLLQPDGSIILGDRYLDKLQIKDVQAIDIRPLNQGFIWLSRNGEYFYHLHDDRRFSLLLELPKNLQSFRCNYNDEVDQLFISDILTTDGKLHADNENTFDDVRCICSECSGPSLYYLTKDDELRSTMLLDDGVRTILTSISVAKNVAVFYHLHNSDVSRLYFVNRETLELFVRSTFGNKLLGKLPKLPRRLEASVNEYFLVEY